MTLILMAIYRAPDGESAPGEADLWHLKHELEVTTETDVIQLPIEARVATAGHFRDLFRGNLEAGKEKHVRILSVRPGSTKEVLSRPLVALSANNSQA